MKDALVEYTLSHVSDEDLYGIARLIDGLYPDFYFGIGVEFVRETGRRGMLLSFGTFTLRYGDERLTSIIKLHNTITAKNKETEYVLPSE